MASSTPTILAVLLVSISGCASWSPPPVSLALPAPESSADTVMCEIAFVQWDMLPAEQDAAFWRSVDEQVLSPEARRRLADNGLRVGIISSQLPVELRKKLGATGDPIAALTATKMERGTEMLSRREKRQCRLGISELVEVLPRVAQKRVVLFNENGRVWAEQFEQPSGYFTVTPQWVADGPLRLEFMPGVEYGEPKQRVIGNQGAFRFDVRHDQRLFDVLGFTLPLNPGQTLVVTATAEPKGLGATFFVDRFTSESERLLLLVRAVRAQSDDLFAPSDQLEPLITPVE